MTAALIGTRIERNTISSKTNDRPTTHPMNQRQAAHDPLAHVDEHRGLATDVDRRATSPATAGGKTVSCAAG